MSNIQSKLDEITDSVNGIEREVEQLEEENENLKEELEALEGLKYDDNLPKLKPESILDQLRNKILYNLARNLTLEELEDWEQRIIGHLKENNRNYIDY